MRRQVMIIGLGQFGMSLMQSLSKLNVDVFAVDRRQSLVDAAALYATEAACFDAMDEEQLARAAPDRRDVCVCAIGDENREAAIICTSLLKTLGAKRVVARATDDLLERILTAVGADEVVNPERSFGQRYAARLLFSGIVEEVPLGADLVVTEMRPAAAMVGRTLLDLELPRRFGITVVALRRVINGQGTVVQPDPQSPLRPDDLLVVVSKPGAPQQLLQRM